MQWSAPDLYAWDDAPFAIIIRSPDDPNPMTRAARQEFYGDRGVAAVAWKNELRDMPVEMWADRIYKHLDDGREVTFNRLVLELTGFRFTADLAYDKAPHSAIRQLVDEGWVEHTLEAPILFRSLAFNARYERDKSEF